MSSLNRIQNTIPRLSQAILLASLCLLSKPSTASAGGLDAGGGYAIRCDDGKLYAWDYVNAPFSGINVRESYKKAKNAKEIVAKIALRLEDYNLGMAESLRDYQKFNEDPSDVDEGRVWLKSTNPLIELNDADITRLPKNCISRATKKFRLQQAVVRYKREGDTTERVFYAADSRILSALEKNNPVQLSFLYIHEWLRDFTEDSQTLSMANQLLHSEKWPANEGAFRQVMDGFGIKIALREENNLYSGKYSLVGAIPTYNNSDSSNYDEAKGSYKADPLSEEVKEILAKLPRSFEVTKGENDRMLVKGILQPMTLSLNNDTTLSTPAGRLQIEVARSLRDGVSPRGQAQLASHKVAFQKPDGQEAAEEAKLFLSISKMHRKEAKRNSCLRVTISAKFPEDSRLSLKEERALDFRYCRENPSQN